MADQETKKVDQNNAEEAKDQETKTEKSSASQDDKKETTKPNDKSPTKPKTPVKETKAKKEAKKKEVEEPEESSDDEELVGILDAPLVVEGKRVRKSTEFLSSQVLTPKSVDRKKPEIPEGKGETLGSMPRVVFQLNKIPSDELKPLHKILFGRPGHTTEVKRNIRAFNGFNMEKDSQEYKKKEEQVDRFTMDSLKRLCEILDVDKGKKEDMMERIMDFLLLPKASGKAVEATKKRSASKKSSTKRKRPEKKEKKSSSKKTKSEETIESDGESEGEDEEEKEPPAKKAKSPEKASKKEKKESKKAAKKEKKVVAIKISPGKKAKKAKAEKKKVEKKKADSDSSDEEPLSKKAKKSPPTNDELVDLVKELLEDADLEKITMKSVCKQVYQRFPDFDLTDRKEFIKDAVKEIIT